MAENKTRPTKIDPVTFLSGLENKQRRKDALLLLELFRETTGFAPVMWGPSIVGFGRYHYIYESGREGDMCATGFSPRKANMSIYIMPGYQDYSALLERLGKHKLGRACLYVNKTSDIDLDVLAELVRSGLKDLNAMRPVHPR